MMRLRNLLTAMVMLVATGAARAEWTLVDGDFGQQKGLTVNTWDVTEGLSVTGESGKLVKIDTRNVLSLRSDRAIVLAGGADGGGTAWRMSLRNGDVLYGEPVGVSGQSLEFKTAELGTVAVPLKLVACISEVKKEAVAAGAGSGAADKDIVRLKNGDMLEGLIVTVDGQKLQISTMANDNATTDIDMGRVERLQFGGVTPARTVPSLSARVMFVSGSVLTVPLDAKQKSFVWTINEVVMKDPAGQERKAAADTIASIDVIGGRVVYLTELDPAKDEHTTLMGTQWATQMNKNVLGQELRVAGKTYSRGLGVHTRSDVMYELDGSFQTLKLQVGMDDSAGTQGTADVSVVLDGKVLWEAKGIKSGKVSEELALPVKGGKRLELRAEPALGGGKVDVLGRVDWLEVALVRP